jgi:hypothetical protein
MNPSAEHSGIRGSGFDRHRADIRADRRLGARLFGLYRLISIPSTAGVHDTRTGVARMLIQATLWPETLGHAAMR